MPEFADLGEDNTRKRDASEHGREKRVSVIGKIVTRTSCTPSAFLTPHTRPAPDTATSVVAIPKAFAAKIADDLFIFDSADIISPIPGDVPSEL